MRSCHVGEEAQRLSITCGLRGTGQLFSSPSIKKSWSLDVAAIRHQSSRNAELAHSLHVYFGRYKRHFSHNV